MVNAGFAGISSRFYLWVLTMGADLIDPRHGLDDLRRPPQSRPSNRTRAERAAGRERALA
jgi:hypothetical protein